MPAELIRSAFPGIAASAVGAREAVGLAPGSTERGVIPVGSGAQRPLGVTQHIASQGGAVTVHDQGNLVEVRAAASLGVGAEIGVIGGTRSFQPIAAASGVAAYSVGQAVSPAAAGEYFTLHVNPRQLSGLV